MKRIFWSIMAVAATAAVLITVTQPDFLVVPTVAAAPSSSEKCDESCINPNRNSFDIWGNEFGYGGNLIQAAPCTTDPISKQSNPYSCQQNTSNDTPAPETVNSGFQGK